MVFYDSRSLVTYDNHTAGDLYMAFTPASCGSDSELSSIVDQLSHKQLAMDPFEVHMHWQFS